MTNPTLKQANALEALEHGFGLYRWLSLSGTWRYAISKEPGRDWDRIHHAVGRNLIRFGWVKFVAVEPGGIGRARYEITKKGLAALERGRAPR